MPIRGTGKYLGFMIGPDKSDSTWHNPTAKYLERCKTWSTRPLGLHYHSYVYNTVAVTTLGYISQLESPPHSTYSAESQGLQLTAPGPGGVCNTGWTSKLDLFCLHEDFGQETSLRSIEWTALAAQVRVYINDNACDPRGDFHYNTSKLKQAI